MAWTDSRVFREWIKGPMMQVTGTGYAGLAADTVKAALFDNTVTPDKDAAVTATGYASGTWTTAREVTGGANWAAGGRALTGKTVSTPDSGVAMFTAANLPAGGTLSLTNAFGCLVYDDSVTGGTVQDQGICFLYFGGAQNVTAGSFTVIWNSNGIVRFSA